MWGGLPLVHADLRPPDSDHRVSSLSHHPVCPRLPTPRQEALPGEPSLHPRKHWGPVSGDKHGAGPHWGRPECPPSVAPSLFASRVNLPTCLRSLRPGEGHGTLAETSFSAAVSLGSGCRQELVSETPREEEPGPEPPGGRPRPTTHPGHTQLAGRSPDWAREPGHQEFQFRFISNLKWRRADKKQIRKLNSCVRASNLLAPMTDTALS